MGAPIFVANQTLATAGLSHSKAKAAVTEGPTSVLVISPEGDELGTVNAYEKPEPGFRLQAQFEVTDVEPLQEGGYRVLARPIVERRAFLYRPGRLLSLKAPRAAASTPNATDIQARAYR